MPAVYAQLEDVYKKLEAHYRDMQDIEFTIQSGKLYLLQTRTGKRTGFAAVKIACDMVDEGSDQPHRGGRARRSGSDRAAPRAGVRREGKTESAVRRTLSSAADFRPVPAPRRDASRSTPSTPCRWRRTVRSILVRVETSPEDIAGMHSAAGILTTRGGLTSHAAVVARGMGRPCIVGAGIAARRLRQGRAAQRRPRAARRRRLAFRSTARPARSSAASSTRGRPRSSRCCSKNRCRPEQSETFRNFDRLLKWADEIRTLGVRTNADTPNDARVARLFGAAGIGLCRTEHMFFSEERILRVREMILARNEAGRRKALDSLLPFQKADFEGIFRELDGLPVTIRLLDPPLHEFLPQSEQQISAVARDMGWGFVELRAKVNQLHESNPMLGHRGCRLGITFPEIYEMQVRAIFQAACDVKKDGIDARPEVMIPLVGTVKELTIADGDGRSASPPK